MTLTIDLSQDLADMLHHAFGNDLSRTAVEGIAMEGYRSEKLSRYEVQKLLGFDNRWDTEEWLGAHGLHMHYSLPDLEADRRTLDKILGPIKP